MEQHKTISIPLKVLEMLADIPMDFQHDANGPGNIMCPLCYSSVTMKWVGGFLEDTQNEIKHDPDCPHIFAKSILG